MSADSVIRHEGFKAIFSKLNPVEAERFLVIVNREGADYTKWRKYLWEDIALFIKFAIYDGILLINVYTGHCGASKIFNIRCSY